MPCCQLISHARHGGGHKFICPGTIEEKVDALIQSKRALAEDLLGGEGAAKILTDMSNAELLDMVRLDIRAAAG